MNVNIVKEDTQKMNIEQKIHNWKLRRQRARRLRNTDQKRRWKKRTKRHISVWGIGGIFVAVLLLILVGTRATALFKDKVTIDEFNNKDIFKLEASLNEDSKINIGGYVISIEDDAIKVDRSNVFVEAECIGKVMENMLLQM